MVPARNSPWPEGPPSYDDVHLNEGWLGIEALTWSAEPFRGNSVLVKVYVQARLLHRVAYGRGCSTAQPVASFVERDYVTVPTPAGWRVAFVYMHHSGDALALAAPMGPETAAAALAGC